MKRIADFYKKPFDDLIKEWYLKNGLSGNAIANKIHKETGINITHRSIHRELQKLEVSRSKSDARKVGISNGRVDYTKLRKQIKSRALRKGISLQKRYAILKRDGFRCVLCGTTATQTQLVLDHLVPVVKNGTNEISNLRTLCRACNHGKMLYDNEK